ncbi:LicD family protein [Maribacter antarcticus]|uniref:LicD family protein n=1 Tax=Maribacter antarcticus TaxID=505250 RepID=UPI00047ACCF6|nr:LicD family protein [Maribacter antarcticus]
MAYDITLEGKNLKEAERLLKSVIKIVEQQQITYWLEGGTLLGVRRENRLLPWDNDLDISVHETEIPKLNSLIQNLKKEGYRIRTRYFSVTSNEFKKGDLRMMKIRNKRFFGLVKGKVCLDVFIKYSDDQNTYWEIDNKTKSVPLRFYENFKTISFQDKSYSIPEDTDGYLTYRYGDWQTPVKDWNTATDDKALM